MAQPSGCHDGNDGRVCKLTKPCMASRNFLVGGIKGLINLSLFSNITNPL